MTEDLVEQAPPKTYEPQYIERPVPRAHVVEYWEVRRAGLSDMEAQALVAQRHGLEPSGNHPWTLLQLVRLQFAKWRGNDDRNARQ